MSPAAWPAPDSPVLRLDGSSVINLPANWGQMFCMLFQFQNKYKKFNISKIKYYINII